MTAAVPDRRRRVAVHSSERTTVHVFPPGPVGRSLCGQVWHPAPHRIRPLAAGQRACRQCQRFLARPACTTCWRPVLVRVDGTARSHHDESPHPCGGTGARVWQPPRPARV